MGTDPTVRASSRTERPDPAVARRFLAAPHVAIVGVHRDTSAFANRVHRALRAPERQVHPVHPDVDELDGDPCVPTVAALPPEVRNVLVMVRPEHVDRVVEACLHRGVDRVWLHRGAGPGAVTPSSVRACREAGVEVVAGACPLMFLEPVGWMHRLHRRISVGRVPATVDR